MKPSTNHEIERFQVERLILFSDAVFAIAITLLVIEIKVPHFDENPTDEQLLHGFLHLIPEFIGFFVSFFVIGIYWRVHWVIFRYVEKVNMGIIFWNLFFLMTIVLMPFFSAFYSKYYFYNLPFGFYCFNVGLTGIVQLCLWRYMTRPKLGLCPGVNAEIRSHFSVRAITVPSVFLAAWLLAIFGFIWSARLIFIFIYPIQAFLQRRFAKRNEK